MEKDSKNQCLHMSISHGKLQKLFRVFVRRQNALEIAEDIPRLVEFSVYSFAVPLQKPVHQQKNKINSF